MLLLNLHTLPAFVNQAVYYFYMKLIILPYTKMFQNIEVNGIISNCFSWLQIPGPDLPWFRQFPSIDDK